MQVSKHMIHISQDSLIQHSPAWPVTADHERRHSQWSNCTVQSSKKFLKLVGHLFEIVRFTNTQSKTPLLKMYSKFVLPNWISFNSILTGSAMAGDR